MHDPILFEQGIHGSVTKMGALITNDGSRDSKPAKQIRSNKIYNNLSIVSFGGFLSNPTLQGYWIEDSKRIGLELLMKALAFS